MKARRITILSLLVIGSIILAACGGAAEPAAEEVAEDAVTVVHLINGTLGDKSFTDSAHRGLTQARDEFGFNLITNEAGVDPAKWEPAFMDAVQNPDTDVIVFAAHDLMEIMNEVAPDYPEITFISFDNPIDFDEACSGCKENAYSVLYLQNEGSYLAGLYAGLMSETGIIGAVGGADIPVINDFIIGYTQGAVDAGLTAENVLVQYAESWSDPVKGKELALTMYQQGADIVFQIAGGTGEGVFYAAEEADAWAIGVDSDQALIIEETNPDQAARILTSMMKHVDKSLYRAVSMYLDGTLPVGTNESLGIPDGVGLAYNKFFDENTPQEVVDQILAAEEAVKSGEIIVDTVF